MNLYIPKEGESFILKEEVTLKISKIIGKSYSGEKIESYFSTNLDHRDKANLKKFSFIKIDEDYINFTLPKDTIIVLKKVDIKRRQPMTSYYGACDEVKVIVIHDLFKGFTNKTNGKVPLQLEGPNSTLLNNLNLEKVK